MRAKYSTLIKQASFCCPITFYSVFNKEVFAADSEKQVSLEWSFYVIESEAYICIGRYRWIEKTESRFTEAVKNLELTVSGWLADRKTSMIWDPHKETTTYVKFTAEDSAILNLQSKEDIFSQICNFLAFLQATNLNTCRENRYEKFRITLQTTCMKQKMDDWWKNSAKKRKK